MTARNIIKLVDNGTLINVFLVISVEMVEDKNNVHPPSESINKQGDDEERKREVLRKVAQRRAEAARKKVVDEHKFWSTQPMRDELAADEEILKEGGPVREQRLEEVSQTPTELPAGYVWSLVDVQSPAVMDEVYYLLKENYVEDHDAMFRFRYSTELLDWSICPPGWRREWHLGVRSEASNELVAFVTAVPATLSVREKQVDMVEVNFLCVHKQMRSMRLAPILITEITRRVNLFGIYQALYTAGIRLPVPVSVATYYHRTLNVPKMVEVGFTSINPNTTLARVQKMLRAPQKTTKPGFRPMERKDATTVLELLNKKFQRQDQVPIEGAPLPTQPPSPTELFPVFSEEEIIHYLLPRENVIHTFVREEEGSVADIISYYILPSSVLKHENHDMVNAAYFYYSASRTMDQKELLYNMIVLAAQNNMDVLNALSLWDNDEEILTELKFGKGDGRLHYYLFNWKCPTIESNQTAVILV